MFCQKKYYPLVYEFLQNFKIPLFSKKIQKLYKNRDYYRKIGMVGLRIPPKIQMTTFLIGMKKKKTNPMMS